MAREEIWNWNLKFAEKTSHEPPPFSQPQLLRIINAPAVSTEDPEDAPWRKGETFSQPSSITKATIISPFPHSHEKEKYDIETKQLVPAGEMHCDNMYTASGWLNTDYYYLKNETYNKRGNAGLNLQLSKSEKGRRWQHVWKSIYKNVFGKETVYASGHFSMSCSKSRETHGEPIFKPNCQNPEKIKNSLHFWHFFYAMLKITWNARGTDF